MTRSSVRVFVAGAVAWAAIVTAGAGTAGAPGPQWKGSESMALVALAPNPDRCGAPPVLEARFAGDGLDTVGGFFTVLASGCLNPDTLTVTDMEATDVFATGTVLIEPGDVTLSLDHASCIATNADPVPFTVGGGTGRFAGATGGGTFHIALNWAPCNGLNVPARVWFEGVLG